MGEKEEESEQRTPALRPKLTRALMENIEISP